MSSYGVVVGNKALVAGGALLVVGTPEGIACTLLVVGGEHRTVSCIPLYVDDALFVRRAIVWGDGTTTEQVVALQQYDHLFSTAHLGDSYLMRLVLEWADTTVQSSPVEFTFLVPSTSVTFVVA